MDEFLKSDVQSNCSFFKNLTAKNLVKFVLRNLFTEISQRINWSSLTKSLLNIHKSTTKKSNKISIVTQKNEIGPKQSTKYFTLEEDEIDEDPKRTETLEDNDEEDEEIFDFEEKNFEQSQFNSQKTSKPVMDWKQPNKIFETWNSNNAFARTWETPKINQSNQHFEKGLTGTTSAWNSINDFTRMWETPKINQSNQYFEKGLTGTTSGTNLKSLNRRIRI